MKTSSIRYDGPESDIVKKGSLNNAIAQILRNLPAQQQSSNATITADNVSVNETQTLRQYLESLNTSPEAQEYSAGDISVSNADIEKIRSVFGTEGSDDLSKFINVICNSWESIVSSNSNNASAFVKSIAALSPVPAVIDGGDLKYPSSGLTMQIYNDLSTFSKFLINGNYIEMREKSFVTSPSSDNYVFITETGDILVQSVAIGDPVADSGAGLLLWKITTNSTSRTASEDLRNYTTIDPESFIDGSIDGSKIASASIDPSAIKNVISPSAAGDSDFFQITYNSKGMITDAINKVEITSIADGQYLRYEAASGKFKNVTVAPGSLPTGPAGAIAWYNGTSWRITSDVFVENILYYGNHKPSVINGVVATDTAFFGLMDSPNITGSLQSGGSLVSGTTYYYKVCYRDDQGNETSGSNQITLTTNPGNRTCRISIPNRPVGCVEISVYRGTVSGTYTHRYRIPYQNEVDDNGGASFIASSDYKDENNAVSFHASSKGLFIGRHPEAYSYDCILGIKHDIGTKAVHIESNISSLSADRALMYIESFVDGSLSYDNVLLKLSASSSSGDSKRSIGLHVEKGSLAIGDLSEVENDVLFSVQGGLMKLPGMTSAEVSAFPWVSGHKKAIYYNETTNKVIVYNGSTHVELH